MRSSLFLTSLLASAVPSLAAHGHGHNRKRDAHHRHVKRSDPDAGLAERDYEITFANGTSSHELAKRQSYTGRGTFYYTGLGACGIYNSDSDFIVALNTPQYNEYGGGYPGPQCWKWITVQANGVTVSGIQITDECPSCDWGSLDMSPGLFQQFAPESVGVLSITWWFDGSSGGGQTTTSSSQWTPTTTSSTWQAPTTTSSSQWTPTTTSSTWSQTSTTSTWSSSSTTTWSAPATTANSTSVFWSATTTANATTNPFVVASSYNSTSVAPTSTNTASNSTATDASGSTGSGAAPEAAASNNNLEAINGLVTNYGQIVVAAAGGKTGTT